MKAAHRGRGGDASVRWRTSHHNVGPIRSPTNPAGAPEQRPPVREVPHGAETARPWDPCSAREVWHSSVGTVMHPKTRHVRAFLRPCTFFLEGDPSGVPLGLPHGDFPAPPSPFKNASPLENPADASGSCLHFNPTLAQHACFSSPSRTLSVLLNGRHNLRGTSNSNSCVPLCRYSKIQKSERAWSCTFSKVLTSPSVCFVENPKKPKRGNGKEPPRVPDGSLSHL